MTTNAPRPIPPFLLREDYWMACSRWDVKLQEPAIATAENPNAQGRTMTRRMETNEVMKVHPILHVAMSNRDKLNYVLVWAVPITKAHYDWVMSIQPNIEERAKTEAVIDRVVKDMAPKLELVTS